MWEQNIERWGHWCYAEIMGAHGVSLETLRVVGDLSKHMKFSPPDGRPILFWHKIMKKAFKLYEKIKKALWFLNFGEFLQ